MLYQLVLHLSFIMLVFIHLFGKIKEAFNCDLLASLDFLMFEWVIQYDRKDLLRGQPTMTECHIRCLENLVMLSDRFANSANFLLMTSLMKMMYIFLMDMNLLLFFVCLLILVWTLSIHKNRLLCIIPILNGAYWLSPCFLVSAISDYKQSLQFQNLNEEKRNIHLEVPFLLWHFLKFWAPVCLVLYL